MGPFFLSVFLCSFGFTPNIVRPLQPEGNDPLVQDTSAHIPLAWNLVVWGSWSSQNQSASLTWGFRVYFSLWTSQLIYPLNCQIGLDFYSLKATLGKGDLRLGREKKSAKLSSHKKHLLSDPRCSDYQCLRCSHKQVFFLWLWTWIMERSSILYDNMLKCFADTRPVTLPNEPVCRGPAYWTDYTSLNSRMACLLVACQSTSEISQRVNQKILEQSVAPHNSCETTDSFEPAFLAQNTKWQSTSWFTSGLV